MEFFQARRFNRENRRPAVTRMDCPEAQRVLLYPPVAAVLWSPHASASRLQPPISLRLAARESVIPVLQSEAYE